MTNRIASFYQQQTLAAIDVLHADYIRAQIETALAEYKQGHAKMRERLCHLRQEAIRMGRADLVEKTATIEVEHERTMMRLWAEERRHAEAQPLSPDIREALLAGIDAAFGMA